MADSTLFENFSEILFFWKYMIQNENDAISKSASKYFKLSHIIEVDKTNM